MTDFEKNPFLGKRHEYEKRGAGELDHDMFKREMQELIRAGDPDLVALNLELLDDYDIRSWMLYRSGSMTHPEFQQRFESALRDHPVAKEDLETDSRLRLYRYIERNLQAPK